MAEPLDPNHPPRPGTPGAPLPRLWKAEPDEPDDPVPVTKKKKKADAEPEPVRKAKKKATGKDGKGAKANAKGDGTKSVLVEETPHLDTYEARQRIRIALGATMIGFVLLTGFIIYRVFAPSAPPPADDTIPPEMLALAATSPGDPKGRDEQDSRILFDRARDVARNGNVTMAVALLKKVVAKYPNTRTAGEARAALDRPRQNLLLFLDRPAVVAGASPAPPAPAPPTPPAHVVDARPTPVGPATGAAADLVPPANPAEPPSPPPGGPAARPSPGAAAPSRPLPAGFRPREGVAVHASGWPLEVVGDRDGAPMVLVPGGTFLQGRNDADPSEAPEHKVVLGTFYVDKHEVTVRQFTLFEKESGPRHARARALARDGSLKDVDAVDDLPVVMVNAREASDYCYWAGKRLPTEAQLEAAARTTDGRIFPWGPGAPRWARPREPRQIDPVMTFPSDLSPYGAFDLAGNAAEWTKDWFDPHYYQLFRTAVADNPTGPSTRPRSQQLVVKGTGKDWAVTHREGVRHDTRLKYLGFRGVLQVEGPGNALEPAPAATPGQPAGPASGAVVPF